MKKLVSVQLIGGLGNQMFQYAIGIILQLENKINVKFDLDFFKIIDGGEGYIKRSFDLDVFDVHIDPLTIEERNYFLGTGRLLTIKRLLKGRPAYYYEQVEGFKEDWKVINKNMYFSGYFQKYEFYSNYETLLLETFQFNKMKISQKALEIADLLVKENSVSIHIRKGDYVKDSITKMVFCDLDSEYYNRAIARLRKLQTNLKFYVFSDDVNWVVENFNPQEIIYEVIDLNNPKNSWDDIFLMTKCKHNILANSTFSWWGAFLNPNPQKVIIAPKKWYYDTIKNQHAMQIYPNGWILI
ncbi:MAG: alpha-1,2-fucosyltransferase [Flavobacteriia bacterium]